MNTTQDETSPSNNGPRWALGKLPAGCPACRESRDSEHQGFGNHTDEDRGIASAVVSGSKIVFVIALLLLLLPLPASVKAQDYNFYTDNGTIIITGYTGPGGAVIIPSTINDLPVVAIGGFAFCHKLTSVTIPEGVTRIKSSAFAECDYLRKVTIPEGVTNIEFDAFVDCYRLTKVTIPNTVTKIGDRAFYLCSMLADVTIGNGVTSIGNYAFYGTAGGNVTIPNSVISIGDYAFSQCYLTNITIGDSVASIGNNAFAGCGLTSVTIPNSVTNVGSTAFASGSLTNLTIGSGVTSIGVAAFASCTGLKAITVDPLNSCYISADGVLFDRSYTTLVQCPAGKAGNYTIPNGVTRIEDCAFDYCPSLSGVTIPNSVISIGDSAFLNCKSLTNVTIPNGVISIGNWAFAGCSSATSLTLPNSVTSIGDSAFSGCALTNDVTIPDSVTNLGPAAFSSCRTLAHVTIGNGITSIGDHTFYACNSLVSITIPSSVTNIGYAFHECAGLKAIYFLGNAPTVDPYAFYRDNAIVYYLPSTTGWGPTFAGLPTMLWNAQVNTSDATFGVQTNQFGFTITGGSSLVVVVETSTNLANWSPLATNTLTGNPFYFTDPQWTNYPGRYYRLRWP